MTYDIWSIILQSDQIVSNSAIGEELILQAMLFEKKKYLILNFHRDIVLSSFNNYYFFDAKT